MLQASLIIARLHAFIGGSVERSSNRFMLHASLIACMYWWFSWTIQQYWWIGRANDSLCAISGSVNRTVNSARLPNRQDWRIGQNILMPGLVKDAAEVFFRVSQPNQVQIKGPIAHKDLHWKESALSNWSRQIRFSRLIYPKICPPPPLKRLDMYYTKPPQFRLNQASYKSKRLLSLQWFFRAIEHLMPPSFSTLSLTFAPFQSGPPPNDRTRVLSDTITRVPKWPSYSCTSFEAIRHKAW